MDKDSDFKAQKVPMCQKLKRNYRFFFAKKIPKSQIKAFSKNPIIPFKADDCLGCKKVTNSV